MPEDIEEISRPWLRKQRIAVGGISVPVSIVVAFAVNEWLGKKLSTELIIAISSLIGSAVTMISICAWDMRDMIYAMIDRKRE